MSLKELANHVRSHGRGEDTVLIHMTPNEVAGLQALAVHHGGSLTINPHTGLPEAGFLSSILPIVAGVGLSLIPGVGPGLAALTVGAGSGLYQGLKSGSVKKGLMGALTGGLGAYGGAGLAGGLTRLGAQGAAAGALESQAARGAAGAVPNSAFQTGESFLNPATTTARAVAQQATTPANFSQNLNNLGRGVGMAAENPGAFVDATGGGMRTGMYGAATLAPSMFDTQNYTPPLHQKTAGGNLPVLSNDFYQQPMYSGSPSVPTMHFNSGGLATLPGYAGGGDVGDGMSDKIPAALSMDEFVVPADVVAHIGNGSSSAGANKLYDMLDRIRMSRTGTTEQPPQVNTNAMLPS